MAKSLSPQKQLQAAARMAIIVLAVDSPERIALAKALNLVAKPKASRADKIHKYEVCYRMHDEHCYCVDCASVRLNGLVAHLDTFGEGRETIWRPFEKTVEAPDRSAEIDALSTCACGHLAEKHEEDELGNLLQCHAVDGLVGDEYRRTCDCDHFHYEVKEQDAA